MDNADDQTWQIRVRGHVQGVGYRDACVQYARYHGVRGWVRNRSDGSVELLLHGRVDRVEAMKTWLQHQVPHARVTDFDAVRLVAPAPIAGFMRVPTE